MSNSAEPQAKPPTTIFVAEPNILVRMVIAAYLRECGFTVIEGVSSDEVMTVLETGRSVDVVFADVNLQGSLDGFALARWIRQGYANTDIVITSGVANAAEKAGDLCEEGPLEKPYHPHDVVRRINILLERRRTNP